MNAAKEEIFALDLDEILSDVEPRWVQCQGVHARYRQAAVRRYEAVVEILEGVVDKDPDIVRGKFMQIAYLSNASISWWYADTVRLCFVFLRLAIVIAVELVHVKKIQLELEMRDASVCRNVAELFLLAILHDTVHGCVPTGTGIEVVWVKKFLLINMPHPTQDWVSNAQLIMLAATAQSLENITHFSDIAQVVVSHTFVNGDHLFASKIWPVPRFCAPVLRLACGHSGGIAVRVISGKHVLRQETRKGRCFLGTYAKLALETQF